MKIIQVGENYNVYDNSVKTFDKLPSKVFTLEFDQREGCYLLEHADITVDEKSYGVQEEKSEKVMKAFKSFQRSLGVILSGDKGIGKTMFAKKLCIRAVECGFPVILVEKNYPQTVRFIEKIDQECVVMFDEFDKSFAARNSDYDSYEDYDSEESDKSSGQPELLSLFDGTSGGKKLFVVTCNRIDGLNSCLINRPGRFHYHFRFEYPTEKEIEEYMSDKLEKQFHGEIPKVVSFSRKVNLNYDCLRAIAFELNGGISFEEAIPDLNIINTEEYEYDITVHFKNGEKLYHNRLSINLYDEDQISAWECLYTESGKCVANVQFNKSTLSYDEAKNALYIPPASFRLSFFSDEYDDEEDAEIAKYKKLKPICMTLSKSKTKNWHYFG